jgi:tape measure domain-containing protein
MTGPVIDTAVVEIVPDFSSFGARAKAGIDAALRGITSSVQQAFSGVERAAGEAGRDVGQEFTKGGLIAQQALRGVANQAQVSMAEVGTASSTAATTMSGRLSGALAMVKTGLLAAGVAAGVGLAALTGFGLKSAAGIEQTTIGLQALTGSAETAQQFLSQLQQFAATTPFEFAGVADASRRILAFGQSVGIARDEVIPTLTTIGDLVSVLGGTQESVDSVVRALGQMASKGKLSQEELMQLAEALPGFNANAAIASSLGLSVADTLSLITAGGVDATTGINALLKGMGEFPGAAGAMAKQSQTLTGVFSTFKDTLAISLSNAFQPVIPEIKSTLAELTPVLGEAIGGLAPILGSLLSSLLPLIGHLVKAITPILGSLLAALGPALEKLGPALEPLGAALGEVVVSLGPLLPLAAEFLVAIAQLLIPALLLLAQVLKPLIPLVNFFTLSIAEFNKALAMIDWAKIGHAIADWAKTAWSAIGDFFTSVRDFFQKLPTWALLAGEDLRDKLIAKFFELVAFVQSIPGQFLAAIGDGLAVLYNWGRNVVLGIWNGIQAMGGWLWSQVTGFVNRYITQPVKDALGIHSPSQVMADEVGRQIPAGVAQGARDGMSDLQGLLSPILPTAGAGGDGALGGLGAITINMVFNGSVPSEADARKLGAAAAEGLNSRLGQRGINLAVRMAR